MDKFLTYSGWVLGTLSFFYAIYQSYQSSVQALQSRNDLQRLNDQLSQSHEAQKTLAATVHEMCFSALMSVKNQPVDQLGFALQREALITSIRSIQKVTHHYSMGRILQGAFSLGSDLSAFETSANVTDIWLITHDLQPEKDDSELLNLIKANADAGKQYHYLYPSYIRNEVVQRIKNTISPSSQDSVEFIRIDVDRHPDFARSTTIVLYESRNGRSSSDHVLPVAGFEEVLVPDERRGGLWRRMADHKASSLLSYAKELRADARNAVTPEYASHREAS